MPQDGNNYSFPKDIVEQIKQRKLLFEGLQKNIPGINERNLTYILETAYLASLETDEGRSLKFNLVFLPIDEHPYSKKIQEFNLWLFEESREFNVQEVRRLSAACDSNSSALLISLGSEDNNSSVLIRGVLDLGQTWIELKNAHKNEELSKTLFLTLIRAESGGHIQIHYGDRLAAVLKKGRLESKAVLSRNDVFLVNPLMEDGLKKISEINQWQRDNFSPQEKCFETYAYFNVLISIINLIQQKSHGGTLVFIHQDELGNMGTNLKSKYKMELSLNHLQNLFSIYITKRNIREAYYQDNPITKALDSPNTESAMYRLYYEKLNQDALLKLIIESCKLIADLSGADGAIILDNTFVLHGFSAEIKLESTKLLNVYEEMDTLEKRVKEVDIEQYGMRHRSAMRLSSALPSSIIFVVSQDGDINMIWNKDGKVILKKNAQLKNTFKYSHKGES